MSGPEWIALPLTVAGSDPSGGAGVELDLRVFALHGLPGAALITSVTLQSDRGVERADPLPVQRSLERLKRLLRDHNVEAAKCGLLPSATWIRGISRSELRASGALRCLVVDPVLAPTRGAPFHDRSGIEAYRRWLLPRTDLLTPNLNEAAALLSWSPGRVRRQQESALEALLDLGPRSVLLKGGHDARGDVVVDRLRGADGSRDFRGRRAGALDVRGTGCALSAAIVARLTLGCELSESVRRSIDWVRQGIAGARRFGLGRPYLYWAR